MKNRYRADMKNHKNNLIGEILQKLNLVMNR